jgi:hypothetical protein
MLRLIPLSILFIAIISACGIKPRMSPIEYNDMIVTEQNKIIKSVFAYVDAVSTGNEKAEKARLSMVEQCKSSLKVVNSMEDYEGNVRLRDAAIDLFKFYLTLSEESFKEISEINEKGEEITIEDLERLQVLESAMDKKEIVLDNALSSAQEEFAKKYNFQLGENKYQKEVDELNKELE